ncbi:MAG: beta-galactosidase small subunit, partial [Eubacterium sp.]|nr:beta-galactosidase small subunit [Eubacterium sp.]
IRPQESGNRCDCTFAKLYTGAVSKPIAKPASGPVSESPSELSSRSASESESTSEAESKVTFQAVDAPFELAVKPYTDRALVRMTHRKDEKRTGTYVTIQAFQQGIGTGICGPGVAREYQYPADRDYTLKFLITY